MNLQDVADFISLVNDPQKFAKALQDLKDEQDRLSDVVATVGKASELDSLRKKLEKAVADKMADLDEKIALVESNAKQNENQVMLLKQSLQSEISKATAMQNDASNEKLKAQELVASFSGRDKALRAQEKQVDDLRTSLTNSVREYEEKLAKLRSVMN